MTLVACTIKSNFPLIVSDIIVSDDVDKSIQLPTNTIDINTYLDNDSKPVRLHQKTYVINDKVCVTLAGRVNEMTEFLKELKMRCSYYEDVTKVEVEQFLKDYNLRYNFSNSAFLILQMQRNEQNEFIVNQFHYPTDGWDILDNVLFDRTYASGSGAGDFLYWMKTYSVSWNDTDNVIYQAIAVNSSYISRLLTIERITLHTIKKNWGGGFEMALFDGNSFVKVDKIAFIIFQVYFNSNGSIRSLVPGLVLFNRYHNDILFISAIEVSKFLHYRNNGKDFFMSNEGQGTMHVVLPIDQKEPFTKEELPSDFAFYTNKVGVGFSFLTKTSISPASYYVDDLESYVSYDKKNIKILLKSEASDFVLSKAKELHSASTT